MWPKVAISAVAAGVLGLGGWWSTHPTPLPDHWLISFVLAGLAPMATYVLGLVQAPPYPTGPGTPPPPKG